MRTMRSGSSNGSGLSTTDRTMLKIAALAARQMISVNRAVAVNVRSRERLRAAIRTSRRNSEAHVAGVIWEATGLLRGGRKAKICMDFPDLRSLVERGFDG